jgi:hypothetical protein
MRDRLLDRTDALLIAWTLFAKVGVLAVGVIALWTVIGHAPTLLEPWQRWDAPHYTDVAIWGYVADDPGTLSYPGYRQDFPGDLDLYIVFFPLFPWLTSAVLAVVGDPVVAAFVVATVASLFVAPLLYRLVSVDLGPGIALKAAAFLLVFPTAYFLHIGYTESLFLALAFGSMWLARTDRWWAAGVIGGLAALTRANGLILIPTLAVEAWLQWRQDRRLRASWLAIGGVGIGFGIYLWLNWSVYGDPFMFSEIQRGHWHKELSWPWDGIASAVSSTGRSNPDGAFMYGWMELLFTGLGAVASIATARWLRPSWGVWMIGNWLLITGTGFVLSVPRYSLVLFGLFVWAALLAERWRWAGWLLGAASAASMAYFAWRFASGVWAF